MEDTNTTISIILIVLCSFGSALFSGMTLGLLSIDIISLKLLINQPDKTADDEFKAKMAKRVLSLRGDGNLLLVTLLIGNVAVNSAFTVLLGSVANPLTSFIISTFVITLFGEIIPQAVCAKYGLYIGGVLSPLLVCIKILLWIISKPIAMILNCALGRDIGTHYTRRQLKTFIDIHDTDAHILNKEEAKIIKGGIDFAELKAKDVMTPIKNIFRLHVNDVYNYECQMNVIKSGYSRIPIVNYTQEQCIVGLIFTRDLLINDPSRNLSIRSILSAFGRNIHAVDSDTHLLPLLNHFKKGKTHLAVVREIVNIPVKDPYYSHTGIITLEDILEEILKDEIEDEFDVPENQLENQFEQKGHNKYHSIVHSRIRVFNRDNLSEQLDDEEALTVTLYLFSLPLISHQFFDTHTLTNILKNLVIFSPPPDTILYENMKHSDKFTLILQGSVDVISNTHPTPTHLGPWSHFGIENFELSNQIIEFIKSFMQKQSEELTGEDLKQNFSHTKKQTQTPYTQTLYTQTQSGPNSPIFLPKPAQINSSYQIEPTTLNSIAVDTEGHQIFEIKRSSSVHCELKEFTNTDTLLYDETEDMAMFFNALDSQFKYWSKNTSWFPEYTVKTTSRCRLLIISKKQYYDAIKASILSCYSRNLSS